MGTYFLKVDDRMQNGILENGAFKIADKLDFEVFAGNPAAVKKSFNGLKKNLRGLRFKKGPHISDHKFCGRPVPAAPLQRFNQLPVIAVWNNGHLFRSRRVDHQPLVNMGPDTHHAVRRPNHKPFEEELHPAVNRGRKDGPFAAEDPEIAEVNNPWLSCKPFEEEPDQVIGSGPKG